MQNLVAYASINFMAAVNAALIDGPTNAQQNPSHSTTRLPAEMYSQVFEGLDVNKDGKIELSELQQSAGTATLEAMIMRCDQNGDALVDIHELAQFLDMMYLP